MTSATAIKTINASITERGLPWPIRATATEGGVALVVSTRTDAVAFPVAAISDHVTLPELCAPLSAAIARASLVSQMGVEVV